MKEYHCVIGNKGGVGKSVVASWLIQFALEQGAHVVGIECDPSNRTLTRYKSLRTERLDLLDREEQIDRRRFDALIEMLVVDEEPFVVMDNGQASFVPLGRYMDECGAFPVLEAAGRACFVHFVVTGGQLGTSTLSGLKTTVDAMGHTARLIVWHNEHFGPIDQVAYEHAICDAGAPVFGEVRLLRWSKPFEDDVQDMLQGFLTFEEALGSPTFGLMQRQRLKLVRDHVFGALEEALGAKLLENARAE